MKQVVPALLAAICASGCVSVPDGEGVEHDPWEPVNRGIYRFNDTVDRAIMKPVARGYTKIVPGPVRKGVSNFSQNLITPLYIVNNFLQGKPKEGTGEFFRFLINSTVGIGGILDIAAMNGIEAHREDFGQTAAVWGVPPGPYVVLPFLGPHTLRDAVLRPLDVQLDPLYHYDNASVRDPLYVLRFISLRASFLPLEEMVEDSGDPYVTIRESYLQNREFQVYDGNPPAAEDEFFDEFLDEDY